MERERTSVEDERHVVLAPLLLQVVEGGYGRIRHVDAVVIRREYLSRRVAVLRTPLQDRSLGQARVVVIEDELEHADHGLLTRLGGETLERLERHTELRSELLQHRHEVRQPAEQPEYEPPILLVRLRGHDGLPRSLWLISLTPNTNVGAPDSPCRHLDSSFKEHLRSIIF